MRGAPLQLGLLATALVAVSMGIQAQTPSPEPAAAPEKAGPCKVAVRVVGDEEVSVGEPFVVEVEGQGPPGTTWSFASQGNNDEVELEAAPATEGENPRPDLQHYRALAFAVGEAHVPPIEAECRLSDGSTHEVASEPLAVRMRSLLPKDPNEQKLADIRPPLSLSAGWPFWVVLGLLVVLVTAGIVWLVRLMRRRGREVVAERPMPELAPDAEAREALARLARSGPMRRGDLRGHYIALTQIAKRYLERRLTAPVLEMTSSETLAFLRQHAHGTRVMPSVRDLVGAADQVKFARGDGAREEGERHLKAVGAMVETLETLMVPAPEASQEGRARG
jgi:hypothetical protein